MRWSRVWALSPLFLAAGLGAVGALAVPAGVWAAALITGAAAGALVGIVLAGHRGHAEGDLRLVPQLATGTATAAILAVGFVTMLGEAALSVAALLLVLTAPALWWCASPRERGRGEPSAAVTAALPPDGHVPLSLSTPQLCELWSLTFDRLYKAGRADTLGIVALRQRCLDELERRNPVGFADWLATGARPASNPGRFVNADQPTPPGSGPPTPTEPHATEGDS